MAELAKAADTAKIEISLFIFFFLSGVISAEKLRDVVIRGPNSTTQAVVLVLRLRNRQAKQAINFSSILTHAFRQNACAQHVRNSRPTKMLFCCNVDSDNN
jgi:hypothetical protein